MRTDLKLTATHCLKTLTVGGLLGSSALAQHVHGIVNVGIVVEEQKLAVSLEAPLSDVVGFEHAPETDAQTDQLRAIAAVLWDADAMFGTPRAAGCTAGEADIDAPGYLTALRHADDDGHQSAGSAESDAHDSDHEEHDHHAEEAHGEHADHDHDEHAEHDDHEDHDHEAHDDHDGEAHAEHSEHDHDEHDHEEHGDHAEVNAQYVWECANPQELNALAALFAGEFKNLETVNVQIVTAAGARVLETDGQVEAISLTAP